LDVKKLKCLNAKVFIKVVLAIVVLYLAAEWILTPIILTYDWAESVIERTAILRSSPEDLYKWHLFRKGLYITRLCRLQSKIPLDLLTFYMIVNGLCLLAFFYNFNRWSEILNRQLKTHAKGKQTNISARVKQKSVIVSWITQIVLMLLICGVSIKIKNISNRCMSDHYNANESFFVLYETAKAQPTNLNDAESILLWENLVNDINSLRKNIKILIEHEVIFYLLYIIAMTILWKFWHDKGT